MKLPSRLSPAFVSGVIDTASNQRHLQLSRAKQMLQFGKLQLSDEVHRSVSQVLQQAAAPYAQGAPCILEKNVISAYQTVNRVSRTTSLIASAAIYIYRWVSFMYPTAVLHPIINFFLLLRTSVKPLQ